MHDEATRLLHPLQSTELKDEAAVNELFTTIREKMEFEGSYLILAMHDAYSVPYRKAEEHTDRPDFTDKVFKGRGVRTCVICMLFAALFAFGFWYLPDGASSIWATLLLMGTGFCIYGPQALVGIVAANQATKEAAAMANGFTGIMGYASTIVSGLGIAFIKETFGWGPTLGAIAGFAIVGMALFLFAWNANADGYKRGEG